MKNKRIGFVVDVLDFRKKLSIKMGRWVLKKRSQYYERQHKKLMREFGIKEEETL